MVADVAACMKAPRAEVLTGLPVLVVQILAYLAFADAEFGCNLLLQ